MKPTPNKTNNLQSFNSISKNKETNTHKNKTAFPVFTSVMSTKLIIRNQNQSKSPIKTKQKRMETDSKSTEYTKTYSKKKKNSLINYPNSCYSPIKSMINRDFNTSFKGNSNEKEMGIKQRYQQSMSINSDMNYNTYLLSKTSSFQANEKAIEDIEFNNSLLFKTSNDDNCLVHLNNKISNLSNNSNLNNVKFHIKANEKRSSYIKLYPKDKYYFRKGNEETKKDSSISKVRYAKSMANDNLNNENILYKRLLNCIKFYENLYLKQNHSPEKSTIRKLTKEEKDSIVDIGYTSYINQLNELNNTVSIMKGNDKERKEYQYKSIKNKLLENDLYKRIQKKGINEYLRKSSICSNLTPLKLDLIENLSTKHRLQSNSILHSNDDNHERRLNSIDTYMLYSNIKVSDDSNIVVHDYIKNKKAIEGYTQKILKLNTQSDLTSAFRINGKLFHPNDIRTNNNLTPIPYPRYLKWENIPNEKRRLISSKGKEVVQNRRYLYGLRTSTSKDVFDIKDIKEIVDMIIKIQKYWRFYLYKKGVCIFLQSHIRSFLIRCKVKSLMGFSDEIRKKGKGLLLLFLKKGFSFFIKQKYYKNKRKAIYCLIRFYNIIRYICQRKHYPRLKNMNFIIKKFEYGIEKCNNYKKSLIFIDFLGKSQNYFLKKEKFSFLYSLLAYKIKRYGFNHIKSVLHDDILHRLLNLYKKNQSYSMKNIFYSLKRYKDMYFLKQCQQSTIRILLKKKEFLKKRHFFMKFLNQVKEIRLSKEEFFTNMMNEQRKFIYLFKSIRRKGLLYGSKLLNELIIINERKSKNIKALKAVLIKGKYNQNQFYIQNIFKNLIESQRYMVFSKLYNKLNEGSMKRLLKINFDEMKKYNKEGSKYRILKRMVHKRSNFLNKYKEFDGQYNEIHYNNKLNSSNISNISNISPHTSNYYIINAVKLKIMNNLIKEIIDKRRKYVYKSILSHKKEKQIEIFINIIKNIKNKKINESLNKIKSKVKGKSEGNTKIRYLARKYVLIRLIKQAFKLKKIRNLLNMIGKISKIERISRKKSIILIIRKWRLFNNIKKQTFNKYKLLYNEMYSIFSNENSKISLSNQSSQISKEDVFNHLFNDEVKEKNEDSNKSRKVVNLKIGKQILKKDYLTLNVLKDFENFISNPPIDKSSFESNAINIFDGK